MGNDNPFCYDNFNYREFWEEREYENEVEKIAIKALLPGKCNSILDIGTNYGRLVGLFSDFESVILSDISIPPLKQAKTKYRKNNVSFLGLDATHTPFADNSFDVVTTIRTLHCLRKIPPVFKEFRRIIKDDGFLIFDFANKRNLKQILLSIIGKSKRKPNSIYPTKNDQNLLNFHPKYIQRILNHYDFYVEKILGVELFREKIITTKFSARKLITLDKKTQRINGVLQITPSVFIRARKIIK